MLQDTVRCVHGPFIKHMTKEWFGGGFTWCHTLECEMGSEVDMHSWPFTKHSSGVLATCLTCMPITPNQLKAVNEKLLTGQNLPLEIATCLKGT